MSRPKRIRTRGGGGVVKSGNHNNRADSSILPKCTVCGVADGKYKCPKCRSAYCNVACCKIHKKSCAIATTTTNNTSDSNEEKSIPIVSTLPSSKSKYISASAAATLTQDPLEGGIRRHRMALTPAEEEEEELEGFRITPTMMNTMDSSDWLKQELSDGGLRRLIEEIDTASNGMGGRGREIALAKAKLNYPNFGSFVDRLLLLNGVIEKTEDGEGLVLTAKKRKYEPIVEEDVSSDGSGSCTDSSSDVSSDTTSDDDSSDC